MRMQIAEELRHEAAFGDYLPSLQALVAAYPAARILELGGGRSPSFTLAEMPATVASYTVNDISAEELALAGPEYDKACFDVTGDVSAFAGQFDVIFSKTLAEHVRDGRRMHKNVLSLLRPGGVAFHMVPTLYGPPFVINRLLPEDLSRKILFRFFPHRRNDDPKFPAYYSWCFGDRTKMEEMLRSIGYSRVNIRSFYGHGYFKAVPLIRQIDTAFAAKAAQKDWSRFGTYAHIMAYK